MIPTYNRPEYFRETLESARAQVYPNIEIIVCDNSTDDRTQALMREYRDDLRVRYVRNKDARTKAENFMPFEHLAQGEFLQWCMDDDILLPDKITLMVDLFLRHPSTALVTSVRGAIDGAGTFMGLWEYGLPLHGLYNQFDGAAAGRIMLMKCINFLGEPSAVLFRWRAGTLPIDVVGVMANHEVLGSLADFYGVPFTHRVVVPETKADFEAEVRRVIEERKVDLVVLARYMQVLSPELCDHLAGRAINIHHSFLPGFKGANPYRQAHIRGVKLIGATAHFVTSDLDEGPIIEQNVVRVDHTMGVSKLVSKGRGQESETLAEAVRLFAEHRVLMDGNRTVIFR